LFKDTYAKVTDPYKGEIFVPKKAINGVLVYQIPKTMDKVLEIFGKD